MRAAAQLERYPPPIHDPHDVSVLLAEQRHRAFRDRVLVGHLLRVDRQVLPDVRVDFRLDRAELVAFDWAMMTEVEAQPLRRDHRSRLANMSAKDFAKRGMDEMRRGVIPLDVAAARFVYLRERGRRLERVAERPDHGILAVHLLDTFNRELPAFAFHHAGVADL